MGTYVNRKLTRSEVRDLLLAGHIETHIERLAEIEQTLFDGYDTVRDTHGQQTQVPLDSARVSSLKAAADLIWKRIDKVVPTPKAIELTGEEGSPLQMGVPDRLVVATKLLAIMREVEAASDVPEFLQ